MRALLNKVIDKLQASFPPNRIVVLLTPTVFAPAAGWATAYVAEHFPGLALPEAAITAAFASGVLAAVTLAYKFIDGWQKAEERAPGLNVVDSRRRGS